MASVRVAVRVRPMDRRETDLLSKCIVVMEGNKTSITNLKVPKGTAGDSSRERTKMFTYDFSYDSLDSKSANFVSQEKVFMDLGSDVLVAAFQGYNACVFAYGQTGSGKSFTMMGDPDDRGLIPRICEGLFGRIAGMTLWDEASFCIEVSYLEIYNERVRDLLRRKSTKAYNLRVREHPKEGPYVEELSKHLVQNYCDVEKLMEVGNMHRTTASTGMNDVSSRSHAIFTMKFTQAKFGAEMPCETVSKIHLVDLAGSERADTTGTSGMRLKEGCSINKSLVTLGSVISALADLSQDNVSASSKKKHIFVPYRDSVLTWLLKDSLGGNSKTIMIATISPADINYGETLSTLRYANRAKNIINKPEINEDTNVKLIRELRAEIARLRELLVQGNQVALLDSPTALSMEERLHENEARVLELTKEWTNKWNETQNILRDETLALRKEGIGVVLDSELPHLIGIDDDLLSTGIILYHLKEGRTSVGHEDSETEQDIVLRGTDLESEHCVFENLNDTVSLIPLGGAQCAVNGAKVVEPTQLRQGAVILLGRTNMFRFNHPKEAANLREKRKSGLLSSFSVTNENLSMLYNSGFEFERQQREELQKLELKRRTIEEMEEKQKIEKAELKRIQQDIKALHEKSEQFHLRNQEKEVALNCCCQAIENQLCFLQAEIDCFDELLEGELKTHGEEKQELSLVTQLKMEIFQELKRLKVVWDKEAVEMKMEEKWLRERGCKVELDQVYREERLHEKEFLLCLLKKYNMHWKEAEEITLEEIWKMLLKTNEHLDGHEDHKDIQSMRMDFQVMPVEKPAILPNESLQPERSPDRCLCSKQEAHELLFSDDETPKREDHDALLERNHLQTSESQQVDVCHLPALAVEKHGRREVLNPGGSSLKHGSTDLQWGSIIELEILEQMRMLAALCRTRNLPGMQENHNVGWRVLEQDQDRIMVYIEEEVQRRLQKLNKSNMENDTDLHLPSEPQAKPASSNKTDGITVNCKINAMTVLQPSFLYIPILKAAAVLDGEKSSREQEGTCCVNEPSSPVEPGYANRAHEGHLPQEGASLTTVKTEKEQDVSPHKSSELEMLVVSPVEGQGWRESSDQGGDGPPDHSSRSEAVSRLDGSGTGQSCGNEGLRREASDLLAHNTDGDISHLELGKPLLETAPVCLSASLEADGRDVNEAGIQENAKFAIQCLPNFPLLDIAHDPSGDTGTSEVSMESLVGEGQEEVSEDNLECQDLGEDRRNSLGYKLAGKLSWLYKGANSHLQNTERAIRRIIERNYPQEDSWYKQICTLVKDLPVNHRINLKVTMKSDLEETAQVSESLGDLKYIGEHNAVPLPSTAWSPGNTVEISQDLQVFCQKLVDFPPCLQELQSLSPKDVLAHFQHLIPDIKCVSKLLLGIYWLRVANSQQPVPQPACVLLFESMIHVLVVDRDDAGDKGALAVFHEFPCLQIKDIHVGFAGQHVRLQGFTEDTILTIYTHSKQLTQNLCQTLLKVLSQTGAEGDHCDHPLLQQDLAQLSLDWSSYTPDCILDGGLRLSSQFKRVLADLVYFLHGNMEEKPSLADMQVLLYTSVKAEVNHPPRPDALSQFLLMESHLGLVQEDGVFHPAPRSITMVSRRAHFEGLALRKLSDIRCVLVGDKDSSVRVDIVFKATSMSRAESQNRGKNSTAALPSLSGYNLFLQSEIWKLTFGCTTEAAFLINYLSTV
ncbi:kinesin-like protein KIF16B isoform X2 [Brienomyrus brachyistius]|uniref:kinesin-like protein KIF16B isoform X2 n=1 Tax=Brienomyrus brachyistius TaxID=42636 RepID=UPI0020B232CD|nr:kinesin-like protein KIF16B isoform X2 [Brienomyrus brachyistius]